MQMELHSKGHYAKTLPMCLLQLSEVCAEACTEKCQLCFGDDDEYQSCSLRKALDSFLMIDVEKEFYHCPYKDFDWSEDLDQST